MSRYHAYLKALRTLQAHWRGIRGRRIAHDVKRTTKAVVIQRHLRGFVKRKQFRRKRQSVVRVQALMRMRISRAKYVKALQEKKQQDDMAFQLQKLQERLQEEQIRNEQLLYEQRESTHRNSLVQELPPAPRTQRAPSSAHLWMQDADGIMSQLQEEVYRLRKENEDYKLSSSTLRNEVDKLKSEKEVVAANFHVKIRQLEDVVREKDKKIANVEKECSKLKDQLATALENAGNQKAGGEKRRSLFRTLGSKKDQKKNNNNGDGSGGALLDSLTGADDLSQAVQSSLAQKSADTAQFLKASAQRISRAKFWGSSQDVNPADERYSDGGSTQGSLTDTGGRLSLISSVGAVGSGVSNAMSSLKGKISAVKGKYNNENGDPGYRASISGSLVPTTSPSTNVNEAFNLDSMPEASLPPGWEARLSRSKGKVYYCNPTLKQTQWDRPTVESLKAKKMAAVAAQKAKQ
jgi:myosin V